MNLSRCEKGHFFDKEKYAVCPHCAQGVQNPDDLTVILDESVAGGSDMQQVDISGMSDLPSVNPVPPTFDSSSIPTTPLSGVGVNNSLGSGSAGLPPIGNIPAFTAGDDGDHTVAFYDEYFSDSKSSGVSPAPAPAAQKALRVSTPCVGWLVATKGVHVGQDFRLKVGKNFIGRDMQMDIVLDGDKSVSRNRHAIVVYEPKQHAYLLQPGESSELVYLNNEVVMTPKELKAYDVITVGDVNLLFIPLCNATFNWTEILKKTE